MSTTTSAPEVSTTEKYLPLIAMIFVTGMTFIDMTIVSIAAPDLEKELGISDAAVQWVINGYILALASLFALCGRIADVYGHKRMAIIGTIVFVIASTMCGFTPTGSLAAPWIITFRVIQGAGAAMLFPAALAIVVAAFPLRERGRALALFFAITGGFTALGPIAGGYLTEWTWRAIFWINIPVAIVALILTSMCHPATTPKKEKIDWRGAVFIVLGMGLSVLGFQQAGTWGWADPKTLGCIIVGLALIAFFVWLELRTVLPLIRIRIFKDRAFVADNFVLFFAMMTFIPVFFFLSMYAQIVLRQSSQDAGLFLMWFFIGFVVASQVGGSMLDRIGSKLPMMLGCAVGAVGYAVWGFRSTEMTASAITPWIIVAGAGIGLLLGPASTDAVNRAIDASYGEVTGITQTLRNYGGALGMAILGTIMLTTSQGKFISTLTGFGLNYQQATLVTRSFSNNTSGGAEGAMANLPPTIQDKILSAIQLDFAQTIAIVLYIMAGFMVLALLVSLVHPGGKVALPEGEVEPEPKQGQTSPQKELIMRIVKFLIVFAIIYALVTWL